MTALAVTSSVAFVPSMLADYQTLCGFYSALNLGVSAWAGESFCALDTGHAMQVFMPSVFLLTLSVHIISSRFFVCILGLRRHRID